MSDEYEFVDWSASDQPERQIREILTRLYGEARPEAVEEINRLMGDYGSWWSAVDAESGPR